MNAPLTIRRIRHARARRSELPRINRRRSRRTSTKRVISISLTLLGLVREGTRLVPNGHKFHIISPDLNMFPLVRSRITTRRRVFQASTSIVLRVLLMFIRHVILISILRVQYQFVKNVVALDATFTIEQVTLEIISMLVSLGSEHARLVPIESSRVIVIVPNQINGSAIRRHLIRLSLCLIRVNALMRFLLFNVNRAVRSRVLRNATSTHHNRDVNRNTLHEGLAPLHVNRTITTVRQRSTLVGLLTVPRSVLTRLTRISMRIATVINYVQLLSKVSRQVRRPRLSVLRIYLLRVINVRLTRRSAPITKQVNGNAVQLRVKCVRIMESQLQ